MNGFFDTLLSGNGCSIEGSSLRNPLSTVVDRMLESHVGPLETELGLFDSSNRGLHEGSLGGDGFLNMRGMNDFPLMDGHNQGIYLESSAEFEGMRMGRIDDVGTEDGLAMQGLLGPQSHMVALQMQNLIHMQVSS